MCPSSKQATPIGAEIVACNGFLKAEIMAMPRLKVMLALGGISHNAILRALALRQSSFKFGHGASHDVGNRRRLVDSYHCSRLNTNTGRLTEEMFRGVFDMIRGMLAN